MSSNGKRSTIAAWLQLLRAGNLLTVPGDPLAGFLLACAAGAQGTVAAAATAAGVSLLLYSAGLLLNDCFDLAEDRRDRPTRPLPAGEVRPASAVVAAVALIALAGAAAIWTNLAAAAVAAAVAVLVVAYDAGVNRIAVVGPVVMGACRGLSLCLGAAAAGGFDALTHPSVLTSAVLLTAYIAAVTFIAAREAESVRVGAKRWAPAAVLVVWVTALAVLRAPSTSFAWAAMVAVGLLAVGGAGYCGRCLAGRPPAGKVQKTIGMLLRNLLVVQAMAAVVVFWPGVLVAAALLAAWPAGTVLARRFYAS